MIQDETILLPHIIADTVIQELDRYMHKEHQRIFVLSDEEHREIGLYLSDKAETCYSANERFAKKVKGKYGREHLYSFMRHWLTGWVIDNRPGLKRLVPDCFANGVEIQEKVTP